MQSVSLTSSSYYYYYASGVCLGASQANSSPGPKVELKGHRPSTTHSGSPSYDPGLDPRILQWKRAPLPSPRPRPGRGRTCVQRLQTPELTRFALSDQVAS